LFAGAVYRQEQYNASLEAQRSSARPEDRAHCPRLPACSLPLRDNKPTPYGIGVPHWMSATKIAGRLVVLGALSSASARIPSLAHDQPVWDWDLTLSR